MKKVFLKMSMIFAAVAMIMLTFSITSCKKDKTTTTTPEIVVDGYYIQGAATAFTGFNAKALMKPTYNEVLNNQPNALRQQLLELYIPIKAGTDGFSIVQVAGSVHTTYGPGANWGIVPNANKTTDEPKGGVFYRGDVMATTTKFNVDSSGLYHVVYDTELHKGIVARVHWGIIGAATPNGWGSSTEFTESAFDLNTITYTKTGLVMTNGDWKLRYSQGWKIELDTTMDLGGGKKGVKVNTNFGNSVDSLKAGGNNIVNSDPGIYDVNLTYVLGTGYTLTLTKTGNIPPIDYSTYQMGIIGNAYLLAPGDTANWNTNFGTTLPHVAGTVYTWGYTIDLIADRQFKFRQGDDWNGKSIGFGDVTMAGPAAANFADSGSDHNFKVLVGGNYTIELKIDATTEKYTVTVTKN